MCEIICLFTPKIADLNSNWIYDYEFAKITTKNPKSTKKPRSLGTGQSKENVSIHLWFIGHVPRT